ncbi:uberolysin/carnocyclin family circular bacteriocin [Bacillus thuringiensis]|nr:uberolysin/carnocyclin family circular bacteriocin [Bacillus thuringiensis]
MNLVASKNKALFLIGGGLALIGAFLLYVSTINGVTAQFVSSEFFIGQAQLSSTLGISGYAAKKAIDIISAAGDLYAIIGLLGVVTGVGAIGYGIVVSAKSLARKYGTAYAASW